MDRNTNSSSSTRNTNPSKKESKSHSPSKKESTSSTKKRNNRDRYEKRKSSEWNYERKKDCESHESINGRMSTYSQRVGKSINEPSHSMSNEISISKKCKSVSPNNERADNAGKWSKSQNRRYDRNGIKEDEETEYKLYRELSITLSTLQKNKWDVGRWGNHPEGKRRGAQHHYSIWRDAYDSYIWEIFGRVKYKINSFKNFSNIEIDFEDFADFAYEFSSGYITPYV